MAAVENKNYVYHDSFAAASCYGYGIRLPLSIQASSQAIGVIEVSCFTSICSLQSAQPDGDYEKLLHASLPDVY